jgi:hypothetical protein
MKKGNSDLNDTKQIQAKSPAFSFPSAHLQSMPQEIFKNILFFIVGTPPKDTSWARTNPTQHSRNFYDLWCTIHKWLSRVPGSISLLKNTSDYHDLREAALLDRHLHLKRHICHLASIEEIRHQSIQPWIPNPFEAQLLTLRDRTADILLSTKSKNHDIFHDQLLCHDCEMDPRTIENKTLFNFYIVRTFDNNSNSACFSCGRKEGEWGEVLHLPQNIAHKQLRSMDSYGQLTFKLWFKHKKRRLLCPSLVPWRRQYNLLDQEIAGVCTDPNQDIDYTLHIRLLHGSINPSAWPYSEYNYPTIEETTFQRVYTATINKQIESFLLQTPPPTLPLISDKLRDYEEDQIAQQELSSKRLQIDIDNHEKSQMAATAKYINDAIDDFLADKSLMPSSDMDMLLLDNYEDTLIEQDIVLLLYCIQPYLTTTQQQPPQTPPNIAAAANTNPSMGSCSHKSAFSNQAAPALPEDYEHRESKRSRHFSQTSSDINLSHNDIFDALQSYLSDPKE